MKKSLLHILVSVGIAAIGFCGVACSDDDKGVADKGENGNVALTAIALDKTSLLMEVGESVTLNPVFTPANATNKSVKWNCDSSAAEVNEGVVTALSVGQATVSVTADDGGYKALCNVEVVADKNAVFVESIEFSEESYAMNVGDVLTLMPTVLPENADNKTLVWSTQDTSIISVDEQGMVEALAIGNATVTALATDGSGVSATVAIAVSNTETDAVFVESIEFSEESYAINVGDVLALMPTVLPENADNKKLEWSTSDTSIILVDEKGNVAALAAGNATVTALATDGSGVSATVAIEVVADKNFVESIEFSKESYAMIVGDVLALMPTVLPENADNKTLAWSTQDTSIISVDEQGMVEALAIGNATVTALATDGSGVSATVTIAVSNPATEVNFSGSDNYAKYTTWHGNKFELDVRTTPADADLRTLNWSFQTLNGKANPEGVSYEVTADKATVCCVVDENSTRNGCKVEVSTSDNSDYAYAQVDFLTYAWIMASKNNGATFEYGAHALCGTSDWKFNYEAEDYLSSQLYFVAYCPSDEQHLAEASPLDYYPNDIIPTSAYTLTSSDPEKLSLEKLEGKGYKLNFLADDLAAVDLTYTCGDFVQTYRINIIQ